MLGEHVSDRPRAVDEDLMLVDYIIGLEAGHLRLLEIMEGHANTENHDVGWTVETVTGAVGQQLSPAGINSAIGGLLGRGLIESPSGFGGGSIYRITEFGRAVLGALRWSNCGARTV